MWFLDQVVGSKEESQEHTPEVTSGNVEVASTNLKLSSGEKGKSAAPVVPRANDEENRAGLGFDVKHLLECTIFARNESGVSEVEASEDLSRSIATADNATKISKTTRMSTRRITSEEEQFAIEVEPAGSGFPRPSFDQIKDNVTVLSSDDESDSKTGTSRPCYFRKRWLFCISASVIVAAICLIAGLALGISRSALKNKNANTVEVSEAAAFNDTTPSTEEAVTSNLTSAPSADITDNSTSSHQDHEENDAAWQEDSTTVTENPIDLPTVTDNSTSSNQDQEDNEATSINDSAEVTDSPTDFPTESPSTSQTVEVTAAGMTAPTEFTCGDDHNLMVVSQCQSDGSESWSSTQVLFCFSRARDGDWYWIRGSDSDYDRWDYTEGESSGTLDFDSIPPGDYLISLVRDSMQPYDVLVTESVTVPDCSTTSA
jgi:hypothetical protein